MSIYAAPLEKDFINQYGVMGTFKWPEKFV